MDDMMIIPGADEGRGCKGAEEDDEGCVSGVEERGPCVPEILGSEKPTWPRLFAAFRGQALGRIGRH